MSLYRGDGPAQDIVVTVEPTATVRDIASRIAAADPRRSFDRKPPLHAPDRVADRSAVAPASAGCRHRRRVAGIGAVGRARRRGGCRRPAPVAARRHQRHAHRAQRTADRALGHARPRIAHDRPRPRLRRRARRSLPVQAPPAPRHRPDGRGRRPRLGQRHRDRRRARLARARQRRRSSCSSAAPSCTSRSRPTRRRGALDSAGPVEFNRSPRVEERYTGRTFSVPEVPREPEDQPFPLLAMIAPDPPRRRDVRPDAAPHHAPVHRHDADHDDRRVPHQPRKRDKRKLAQQIARFDEGLAELGERLEAEKRIEQRARVAEIPSSAEARAARRRGSGPLLWTRRPEHWSFLSLRLGSAAMPSRNTVDDDQRGDLMFEFQERLDEVIDDAPPGRRRADRRRARRVRRDRRGRRQGCRRRRPLRGAGAADRPALPGRARAGGRAHARVGRRARLAEVAAAHVVAAQPARRATTSRRPSPRSPC